jgi:thiamine biosynthesis protein ThiS
MELIVNGESRRFERALTARELLAELGLDPGVVVLELNRRIVRRPELERTRLDEGDAVELVHFVGGG